MTLPPLKNWEETRTALHQAALTVGTIAKLGRQRDPKFFHHLALYVTSYGLTTSRTDFGAFEVNFLDRAVKLTRTDGNAVSIPLLGHSQVSLTDAILNILPSDIEPDRSDLTSDSEFRISQKHAADYAQVLYSVAMSMRKAREKLTDDKTDLVVFPHHFDLSCLWFNAKAEDEHQPHVNFGFSPGDEVIPAPYFYSYAWDGEAYVTLDVNAPLTHDPNFSRGVVVYYEDLRSANDLDQMLGDIFQQIEVAVQSMWS